MESIRKSDRADEIPSEVEGALLIPKIRPWAMRFQGCRMIRQEAQPRGGCVTRCKRMQARAPALHKFSGNSLHNFVLENLLVDNEIAGVGRTPWRSIGERNGVGVLRLALPFRKLKVVLAQEDRGILYSA